MRLGFMSVCMIIGSHSLHDIWVSFGPRAQMHSSYFCKRVFGLVFVCTELKRFCIAGIFLKTGFASTCSAHTSYRDETCVCSEYF